MKDFDDFTEANDDGRVVVVILICTALTVLAMVYGIWSAFL